MKEAGMKESELKIKESDVKEFDTKMKEFDVTITEILEKTVTVVADNKEEAERIVKDQWKAKVHVLGAENFIGVEVHAEDGFQLENQLHVLLVEPGKVPVEVSIGSELEDLQEVIGGHIEVAYYFEDPAVIVCDEEGKIKGLPLNRAICGEDGEIKDIMAGSFLICGDGEEDFESLPKELMEKYKTKFEKPEEFFDLGGKIVVCPVEVMEGKLAPSKSLQKER